MSYPSAHFIDDHIYLGDLAIANNYKWLVDHKISYIIDVVGIGEKFSGIKYLTIPGIVDVEGQDILQYFPRCFNFASRAIADNSNILIHCYAGISRSSTIVIAYLMYLYDKPYNEISFRVKAIRSIVNPNPGFVRQLEDFQNISPIHKKIWVGSQQ